MPQKKVDAATIDRLHIAIEFKQISCQANLALPKTLFWGKENTF